MSESNKPLMDLSFEHGFSLINHLREADPVLNELTRLADHLNFNEIHLATLYKEYPKVQVHFSINCCT